MAIADGGSAFPVSGRDSPVEYGMSLRDYFAGQALIATIGNWSPAFSEGAGVADKADVRRLRAEWAYAQADAMLKARGY